MATRDPDLTLELSEEAMRRLVDEAMRRIVPHITSLAEQPAAIVDPGLDLARRTIEPLPEDGSEPAALFEHLFGELVPHTFNTASPGYLAFIPGGGLFHSAVADLVASSINRYVGVAMAAPGLVRLEMNVIRWFCDIVGFPTTAGGLLTTGGSMANLTAIVTARTDRLPENFLHGVIYASDQVHHSITKSARIAGFPPSMLRSIPTDSKFQIRLDLVEEAIARDRAAGLEPFLVVGSAGTTNTGAVDNLTALADIALREELWFHVDAAYGGFFMLTERGRRAMRGIERCDSLSLDPHKGLFLPYGTGSLLVRDVAALQRAHSMHADYMPPMQGDGSLLVDFCEISPELSRDFRGLRVWLPIRMHGIGAFRHNLDEKLDLTLAATEGLRRIDGIEIVAEPQLSIVAFRLVRPNLDDGEIDRLNRRLMERVNARGRVFLTGTMLGHRFAIRICVLSFRTHQDRIDAMLEDLRAAIAEI